MIATTDKNCRHAKNYRWENGPLNNLSSADFVLVGAVRFELTTTGTPCRYATRLRYAP